MLFGIVELPEDSWGKSCETYLSLSVGTGFGSVVDGGVSHCAFLVVIVIGTYSPPDQELVVLTYTMAEINIVRSICAILLVSQFGTLPSK